MQASVDKSRQLQVVRSDDSESPSFSKFQKDLRPQIIEAGKNCASVYLVPTFYVRDLREVTITKLQEEEGKK